MNITSAINKTSSAGYEYIQIVVEGETMDVPKDTNNRHYAEILQQVADGVLTITDE